jgi:hypothetical protein
MLQQSSSYHYGSTWAAQAAYQTEIARVAEAERQARANEQSMLLQGQLAASIARAYRARMVELTGADR